MKFDFKEFKQALKFFFLGGVVKLLIENSNNLIETFIVITIGILFQIIITVFFPVPLLVSILVSIKSGKE